MDIHNPNDISNSKFRAGSIYNFRFLSDMPFGKNLERLFDYVPVFGHFLRKDPIVLRANNSTRRVNVVRLCLP